MALFINENYFVNSNTIIDEDFNIMEESYKFMYEQECAFNSLYITVLTEGVGDTLKKWKDKIIEIIKNFIKKIKELFAKFKAKIKNKFSKKNKTINNNSKSTQSNNSSNNTYNKKSSTINSSMDDLDKTKYDNANNINNRHKAANEYIKKAMNNIYKDNNENSDDKTSSDTKNTSSSKINKDLDDIDKALNDLLSDEEPKEPTRIPKEDIDRFINNPTLEVYREIIKGYKEGKKQIVKGKFVDEVIFNSNKLLYNNINSNTCNIEKINQLNSEYDKINYNDLKIYEISYKTDRISGSIAELLSVKDSIELIEKDYDKKMKEFDKLINNIKNLKIINNPQNITESEYLNIITKYINNLIRINTFAFKQYIECTNKFIDSEIILAAEHLKEYYKD